MSNRLTFSLTSLIVLIALGLVFVATPAMAATLAGSPTVGNQTWVQGQADIDITFPEATASTDDGVLTVTLTVNGVRVGAGDVDAAGGPLQGLTYASTVTPLAAGTPVVRAKATGSLKGDNAHGVVTPLAVVVYTVSEESANTDPNPADVSVTFNVEIVKADDLEFPTGTSIDNLVLIEGNPYSDVLPAATGGVLPLTYALYQADSTTVIPVTDGVQSGGTLAAGLTFTQETRLLAGIPTASANRTVIRYRVSDSSDVSTDLSFTIEVTARPTGPSFAITKVADAAYTKDHAITAMELPEADTTYAAGSVTYTLTGLPAGLSFDGATRMLSGTATETNDGTTSAMYTATDAANNTATVPFKITVADVVSVTAPADVEDHVLGEPFTDINVADAMNGTGDKTVTVTGLPAGLTFSDMMITGDPTAIATTTVSIDAVDSLGAKATTANFTIEVKAAAAIVFTSVVAPQTYEVNKPITPMLLPQATGGVGTLSYALEGLPDGITFDPTTRLLRGTPTAATATADYDYVISDSAFGHIPAASRTADHTPNSITLPISITVTDPAPVTNSAPDFGDATIASITATSGVAIQGMFLPEATDADGDAVTYSLAPALPKGLTFSPTTRALTGTPTVTMAETAYTYTATATGGTDTIGFFITVNAAPGTPQPPANMPPAFADDVSIANIVATQNEAIQGVFLPEATDPDGDRVAYAVSPALPRGLTFNRTTRALTGTPTVTMAQTAYTYTAIATGGTDTLNFFITVSPEANVAPVYADSTTVAITGTVGVAITPVTVAATDANSGDTLTYSWDVDSALLGLTLNPSTGTISGTPLKVHSGSHPVTATDSGGLTAMRNVTVNIAAAPAVNVAPDVTITTTAPTAAQTDSFAIAYTATDANAGDTVTVSVSHTISPTGATGYTVDSSVAGMVTITQAAGSPIAVIEVTITATDAAGLSDSESISVTFAAKGTPPVDTTAPTVEITIAPADDMTVAGTTYMDVLSVTLDFNEPINAATLTGKIGRVGGDTYEVLQIGTPMVSTTDNTVYTVYVNSPGYEARAETRVLLKLGVQDVAGNPIPVDNIGRYTPPAVPAPTVAISANPNPINCETGSTITFTITGSTQTLVAADITVGAGWIMGTDKNPADGTINIVPDGNNAIGITTVKVSVAANAVMNAAPTPTGNAAADMTFTVGPVLTIPAGGYIAVTRPEHANSTHLRDPLYVGHTGVRAPMVDIQSWECMPDLTIFFRRAVPAIGGGAIVIKEADGPLGHDPGGTKADIAKGSVGLSEIMWASDEGITHGGLPVGGRSNIDQTREQWIELHNRNTVPVKVTLFARPTNTALTTEADEIDRVSNFNIDNVWEVPGQSGNSEFGTDFVSMQRGKHDNKGLAPNDAAGYAHNNWNGSYANRWSVSTLPYLTRRAGLAHTGQLAADNLNYNFLGTPGRDNKPTRATPLVRENVPKNSIVFNEVANRRDQTLEWIELKNVSDAEVNLKKYQISLATAKGTDVAFYTFPDNDNIKLAAGELLLLLDTSPRDNDAHPIAVGQDRDTDKDQALGLGQNQATKAHLVRYKVANFREGGLPDDGNFMLILRKRNDRLKSHEGVIDAIGWSDKLADDAISTKFWPLRVFDGRRFEKGGPDARNKIAVETVHYRQRLIDPDANTHKDDKDEHQALRDAGYTGIGYKRHAQRIAAHGGTPGYEEIRKNENPQLANGNLTISEIMYAQGDGDFPQWIEIYNSSETEAVNLHAGDHGWRLIIENFDDGEIPVKRLSGTLNFRSSEVQTILPQQTVIVASTRARNSGSAFFDTRVVFPATRVFSVWDDARGEFDMTRSTDPILSEQGFYIELIDGKNNFVDGVGNLVKSPNRRVAATIEWPLSDVNGEMMDDMGRSSILRRYREYKDGKLVGPYSEAQIEAMGVEAAGWIAAYKTDFLDVRQTWFGHPDDYGSPGITGGRVLPVSLSKFRPERLESGAIVIRWVTESETNNAGFNILRSETKDGEFKQINTKLIAGQGTTSERNTYTYTDPSAKPNVVYYYQIQDVSLDGKVQTLRVSRLKGHISAAGKLTTTWGELKALQ